MFSYLEREEQELDRNDVLYGQLNEPGTNEKDTRSLEKRKKRANTDGPVVQLVQEGIQRAREIRLQREMLGSSAQPESTVTRERETPAPKIPDPQPQPEAESIQRTGSDAATVSPRTEKQIDGMRKSGGVPLGAETREFMESRMGHDFSDVRIHTGNDAESTSKDLNAKAYTVGKDIAFNKGEYQPGSNEGKKLLAHELAHTIQQGGVKRKAENEAGSKTTDSVKVQTTPNVQRKPTRFSSKLSEEQISTAIKENRALHDYTPGLFWRLARTATDDGLVLNLLRFADSVNFDKDKAIGRDFVLLIEHIQALLRIPQAQKTGVLDARTQRLGLNRFNQVQKRDSRRIASLIVFFLEKRDSAWYRLVVFQGFANAQANGHFKRTLKFVEADSKRFGQSNADFIVWLYRELKEQRGQFARLVFRSGDSYWIGQIRNAQFLDTDDSEEKYNILMSISGDSLKHFLFLLGQIVANAPGSWETMMASYIFNKLEEPLHKEKVRRHFFTQSRGAKSIAAIQTVELIVPLLEGAQRIENDMGILMYFRTAPTNWRENVLYQLSLRTQKKYKETAELKLQSTMLPWFYQKLQSLSGLKLTLPARKLTLGENARVVGDVSKMIIEAAGHALIGLGPALIKAILKLVNSLGAGVIDTLKIAFDSVMTMGFILTDGKIGSESAFRMIELISGVEAFVEDPIGLSWAMILAAWDDTVVGFEMITGTGSTGKKVQFILDTAASFILNLALLLAGLATGVLIAAKILARLRAILKGLKSVRRFRAYMALWEARRNKKRREKRKQEERKAESDERQRRMERLKEDLEREGLPSRKITGEHFEEIVRWRFRKKIIKKNEIVMNPDGKTIFAEIDFETAEALVEVGKTLHGKLEQIERLVSLAKKRGKRVDVIYGPWTTFKAVQDVRKSVRKKWGNRVRLIPY